MLLEAGWPSGLGRWISMRWLRFKSRLGHLLVLFWVSVWFNSSVILVNSSLVCLPPVGILNSVVFICFIGHEKPLMGSGQLSIYLFIHLMLICQAHYGHNMVTLQGIAMMLLYVGQIKSQVNHSNVRNCICVLHYNGWTTSSTDIISVVKRQNSQI